MIDDRAEPGGSLLELSNRPPEEWELYRPVQEPSRRTVTFGGRTWFFGETDIYAPPLVVTRVDQTTRTITFSTPSEPSLAKVSRLPAFLKPRRLDGRR